MEKEGQPVQYNLWGDHCGLENHDEAISHFNKTIN